MCADEMCRRSPTIVLATNQPIFNAPENKEVRGSAGQNLPCIAINLLFLLVLLFRR